MMAAAQEAAGGCSMNIQPGVIYKVNCNDAELARTLARARGWSIAFSEDARGRIEHTALVYNADDGYQAEVPTRALDELAAVFPPDQAAPLLAIHARYMAEQGAEVGE